MPQVNSTPDSSNKRSKIAPELDMAQPSRPISRHGFEIAVICALTLEADAVEALFDIHWDENGPPFDKAAGDPNAYSTGAIGRHNVVLAHMPGMGKASAAVVASNCRMSFPNIKLALVVGVCGAVPFGFGSSKTEIVLGDVVISDGVIQYDFGRRLPKCFKRKDTLLDSLGRPNLEIRGLLAKLKGLRGRKQLSSAITKYLGDLQQEPDLNATYPGILHDKLFQATYRHTRDKQTCEQIGCNGSLVQRQRLQTSQEVLWPAVHFGLIASGDSVMKSGKDRDVVAAKENVIAFEMESAGVWDIFPCVVIKGACDYADSHKSKLWQHYAAATAAACMKGFLSQWVPSLSNEPQVNVQDQTQQQERKEDKDKQCLRDLYETNPNKDKERIEDTKGGLLRDSYIWILDNADFKQFRNDPQSRLLWIKGDPGKGKTMLLCGIIDELQKKPDGIISYFFCQATVPQLRNATSVLRGLMHLLLDKRPALISHLRARYDTAGEKLFQGINMWGSLSEILTAMLRDPTLTNAVFVVDALDECTTNRSQLLDFIVKSSSTSHVKWIISSRNWPDIEEKLDAAEQNVRLQLELNQASISNAITLYINHKVNELGCFKNYDEGTRRAVQQYLAENAKGTFLWVALVCQELAKVKKRHTLEKLKAFPPDLNVLYSQMMKHINNSVDADDCKQILAISSVVYRPISLHELRILARSLEDFDQDELREITKSCGGFLTLRDDIVEFVHQSAKDYLLTEATDDILPSGISDQHHAIFLRSLEALSQTLKRDICGLGAPGFLLDQVSITDLDVLDPIHYSTIYWVDHLSNSKFTENDHDSNVQDGVKIRDFIRKKYLYWLESLSLLHGVPEGVTGLQKLEDIVRKNKLQQVAELVQDARRFLLSHKLSMKTAPLQLYTSALLFSPTSSLVRRLFEKEQPDWVMLKSVARTDWGGCLQTLEGHDNAVYSVAFSPDSKLVASASGDRTIRIWDAETGECAQVLEGHDDVVTSVAFSPDSKFVASASEDTTIRMWQAETGECTQTLEGHYDVVSSVAFSPDSKLVVSASGDQTIRMWQAETGECIKTLEGRGSTVYSVAISPDSKLVALASYDKTIRIWDAETGECAQVLEGHDDVVTSVAVSPDSKLVASAFGDRTIRIWQAETGECTQTLKGHDGRVYSVAFSPDSKLVAASDDRTIRIWDAETGECAQVLEGHYDDVTSVAFSPDSKLVASASDDSTIRIWDAETGECTKPLEGHGSAVTSVAVSPDSKLVASASDDSTIRIWDAETGECAQVLEGHYDVVTSVAFSPDSKLVASASGNNKTIRIWHAETGECTQTLEGHGDWVISVAFSPDSKLVASVSENKIIRIWDADTGECAQTLKGHDGWVYSVVFSPDSKLVASASDDRTIRIWDAETGECMKTLEGHGSAVTSVTFSPDSERVASASYDKTDNTDLASGDRRVRADY